MVKSVNNRKAAGPEGILIEKRYRIANKNIDTLFRKIYKCKKTGSPPELYDILK